jgi:uncharacterized cupredoxin-like copper-binding protein
MAFRNTLRLLILLSSLTLVACSGGPPKPVEVQVNANEFSFESSVTTFSVGTTYRFVVTNTGKVAHEFMIVPPTEVGMMDMGEIDEKALAMISEDELPPEATKTVEYTFREAAPTGGLEFACHVAGHYEAGMKLPIVVKGTAPD